MKTKYARWLEKESVNWVSEKIISPEQAAVLNKRYAQDEESTRSFGTMLFGGFGAVILALGIILLFAYNWQDMHRYTKLAILFSAFLASHVAGVYCFSKGHWQTVGAVLNLLGTLLFGANMALISQIYHTGGALEDLLGVWALASVAVAWAGFSVVNGIAACVLIFAWSGYCIVDLDLWSVPAFLGPVAMAVACGCLAFLKKSYVLTTVTLLGVCSLIIMNLFRVFHLDEMVIVINVLALGILMNAIGFIWERQKSEFNPGFIFKHFGYLMLLVVIFICSTQMMGYFDEYTRRGMTMALPCLALIATVVYLVLNREGLLKNFYDQITAVFSFVLPLAWIYLCFISVTGPEWTGWVMRLSTNLILLGLSVKWMLHGANTTQWIYMVRGSIVFVILAGFRFFDTFDSLLARGACFVVVGVSLFGIGFYYNRVKKEKAQEDQLRTNA